MALDRSASDTVNVLDSIVRTGGSSLAYQFIISSEFDTGAVNSDDLVREIRESDIITALDYLNTDLGTDVAEIVFKSALSGATNLSATYTWNGTTTVTTSDTSEVILGDWIRLNSDNQWFKITTITPNTSVVIANPSSLTIPTGSTTSAKGGDVRKLGGNALYPRTPGSVIGDHTGSAVQPAEVGYGSVLNATLSTPPGSPVTGDRYIVAPTGTGLWSGHDNEIAEWNGSAWVFASPVTGISVYAENNDRIYTYDGSIWTPAIPILGLRSLTSDPASPVDGEMWHNATVDKVKFRSNAIIKSLGQYPFNGSVKTIDPTDPTADYSDLVTAIAALSSGDTLLIGPGNYVVTDQIIIPGGAILEGIGSVTIRRTINTGNGYILRSISGGAILKCINVTLTYNDDNASNVIGCVEVAGGSLSADDCNFAVNASGGGAGNAFAIDCLSSGATLFRSTASVTDAATLTSRAGLRLTASSIITARSSSFSALTSVIINNAAATAEFIDCAIPQTLLVSAATAVYLDGGTRVGIINDSGNKVQMRGVPLATYQEKTVPVAADKILVADSADSHKYKMAQVGNLPDYIRLEMGVSSPSAVITTGAKGRKYCSIAGTIIGWRLVADVSSTVTVDIWKANAAIPTNANTITASAKPALSAVELNASTTLTGWTTAVAAGDVFILEVEANNNAKYLALELWIKES